MLSAFIFKLSCCGLEIAGHGVRPLSATSRRRALVVAVIAVGAPGEVARAQAEAAPLRLELNRLEPVGEACRAYLVIENPSAEAYRSLKLDLFAFDTDGVIARRVALEAGPVPARKTSVKLFDFAGAPCERLSRVLLNDVIACEGGDGARADCLALVETRSKVGRVKFGK
jgi:hypothetical protein